MNLPTDISSNRHKGNPHSVAANAVADKGKGAMRLAIIGYAKTVKDFTMKEVCRAFGKLPNELSGRLSELKAMNVLEAVEGESRERCGVLRLKV